MKRTLYIGFMLVTAQLWACGKNESDVAVAPAATATLTTSSVDQPPEGGAGGTPAGGTTQSTSTNTTDATAQGGAGGAGTGGAPQSTSSGATVSTGDGGASIAGIGCGDCQPDEYCHYGDLLCGAGQSGTCKKAPKAYTLEYNPVCGCDGKFYGKDAVAWGAGTDIAEPSHCGSPFECGADSCASFEMCVHTQSGFVGCDALPPPCLQAPSCECLQVNYPSDVCDDSNPKAITISYQ